MNRALVSYYLSKEIRLCIVTALCHLDSDKSKQSENRERKLVGFIRRLEIGFIAIWINPNPEVHDISWKLRGFPCGNLLDIAGQRLIQRNFH
jgi:hypothetical protein